MTEISIYQSISSNFEQEIILGDRLVSITLTWNVRSNSWYLFLTDIEKNDSIAGIKLVPNWLILRQYKSFLPDFDGDFLIIKEDPNAGDRLTYDNLGVGYKLYWVNSTEAEDWEDENGLG